MTYAVPRDIVDISGHMGPVKGLSECVVYTTLARMAFNCRKVRHH